jgi:hypothetical protein
MDAILDWIIQENGNEPSANLLIPETEAGTISPMFERLEDCD